MVSCAVPRHLVLPMLTCVAFSIAVPTAASPEKFPTTFDGPHVLGEVRDPHAEDVRLELSSDVERRIKNGPTEIEICAMVLNPYFKVDLA